jgi:glycosyltransferase involved in cell wall biosynthesis
VTTSRGGDAPLVSVIVPCFNYGRFVGAAIESALSQGWSSLEVIAVDDGSTDDSLAVLETFGSAIRVIHRENGGVNAATDTGIAAASGELITFLDADDTWPAGRVRVLAQALLAHPEAGAVYGDMRVFDEHGGVVHASFNAHKGFADPPSGRFLGRVLAFNCVSAGAMMIRAAVRDRVHPIPPHGGWHDWWIATQILREMEIIAVPDIVNFYRQHGANSNMGADEERAVGLLRTELPFRRWVIANTAPPLVAVGDLLGALKALDWALARIARFDGVSVLDVFAEDREQAQRAFAAGHELMCAGESESGLAGIIAAAACAPSWDAPRALIEQAVGVLRDGARPQPAMRAAISTVSLQAVLAAPSWLAGWVAEHASDDDDATLVIAGVSDDARRDALVGLIGRLGLDDTTADLLAVPEHDPAIVALRLARPVRPISIPSARTPAGPVRVSVVIPCFNYGRYLPDAVESVLAGSLREFEVIIVDDGSSDDSVAVAQRLIDAHPEASIQLIAQPNCGAPGQVRNVGIAQARGAYILCLDADDKLHLDFLRACADALDAHPEAGIAYADFQMFGDADTLQQPPPTWNARVELDCNFVGTASMFRRQAWQQVGGYEPDRAMVGYEDWDFWVGCVEHGWSGVKVPGALWYYRVHGGSIYSTHVRRDQELKARIVLKHPSMYCDGQRRWATGILAGDPIALQTETRVGWMPPFVPSAQRTPVSGAGRPAVRSVCLISRDYPPAVADPAACAVQAQARLLATAGVEVHVITQSANSGAAMREDAGVIVHEVPAPRLALPAELDYVADPVWSYVSASKFTQLDATARFDVVEAPAHHAQALHLTPREQTAVIVWLRAPTIDAGDGRSPADDARRGLEIAALARADLLLATSRHELDAVGELMGGRMRPAELLPELSREPFALQQLLSCYGRLMAARSI